MDGNLKVSIVTIGGALNYYVPFKDQFRVVNIERGAGLCAGESPNQICVDPRGPLLPALCQFVIDYIYFQYENKYELLRLNQVDTELFLKTISQTFKYSGARVLHLQGQKQKVSFDPTEADSKNLKDTCFFDNFFNSSQN